MRVIRDVLLLALLMTAAALSLAQSQPDEPEPDGGTASEAPKEEPKEEPKEGKPEEGPTLEERLDALLSEVSEYEGREPQRCLSTRTYRTVKVLNPDYLLFSRGSKYWLNKLKNTCQPLKFNDLPVFETRGTSSLCENDPFYPSNSMDLQRGLDGGRPVAMHGVCFLGSFEAISAEQAALLTE
jgi:hypothetical protein